MLTEKETTHISKFLSLVLPHEPETIGVTLDENGWVSVDTLLERINISGTEIDIGILKYIVDTNAKKRFAFNEDLILIRASQGHSVTIDLGYTPQQPPEILYHGTPITNIESILQHGLEKRERHHVHLSSDIATATNVGNRHGKPIVFEVASARMYTDGYTFIISENKVWLTDNVPPKYLTLLE